MARGFLFSIPGILLLSALVVVSEQQPVTAEDPDLAVANRLFLAGKFSEAIPKFQQALKANPKLIPAQAGLIRAYLRNDEVDHAFELAKTSLAAQPDSAMLLAAMGSVQYRRGEFPEAEASFIRARKADPNLVEAYLGLAQVYRTALLCRRAYDLIQRAHEIAPQNPEVQRAWLGTLPRRERMKALQAYLEGPHPDDAEETASLHSWLEYLKATVNQPVHACRLANKVEATETRMEILLRDTRHVSGYGLIAKINDQNQRLLLDTGASGILINRKAADKAGLPRISSLQFRGIGEKGGREGYFALADRIRIGDLEFRDCVVTVSEKSMGLNEDGLIGADVFGAYVVDIDIPGDMLRLTLLPKRPDETAVDASLASEKDAESEPEDQMEFAKSGQADEKPHEGIPERKPQRLPMDRYIAPEMVKWTRVYKIGHDLLISTKVNDSHSMLFVIDTGSFTNTMSTRAAREVTKVRSDETLKVKGLSGEVNKVYSADSATLQFDNVRQPNQDLVTFDLSGISKNLGVEVSGFLGFSTFRQLEMKIDYRDGLVQFVYDPSKLPPALRPR